MSQASNLIKSDEFWSTVSDLDQAEAGTESCNRSLRTSLAFQALLPSPCLGYTALQCCGADYFPLIFALWSPICHKLCLSLCTDRSQSLAWCVHVSRGALGMVFCQCCSAPQAGLRCALTTSVTKNAILTPTKSTEI